MPDVTLTTLQGLKQSGEKIAMLTCYDATFAHTASQAGVDVLLVGDSLGMVLQGHDSTLPVSNEEMAYHTACVKRGNKGSLIVTDLAFESSHSVAQTLADAVRLMQAGAHMVKLEGGAWLAEPIARLAQMGVPVCAHLGLTRRRSTCSAASRSRAARKPRRASCAPMPSPWSRPAPPCCCWSAYPACWPKRSPRR
ncbi:3-methyl-2-oxobutanoate hydroxymethyltransferase [Pseudomonas aeruginosa]|nr:3-methyl-2-oxobutanoate hydroxymethyltransferase [Pseudomonas aeruginosa]